MAANEFLGKGMKFPPQVNKATGRFMVSSLEESVKEAVYLILMTTVGERFMRPSFGSNLMNYTFMDVNATNIGIMIRSIQSQIKRQEPRISNVEVDVDSKSRQGTLLVNIEYTIIANNTRDNLVFPFYLNTVNEEPEPDMDTPWEATEPDDTEAYSEEDA